MSPGRTVTEADIVVFAGLSGDYNVLHTDAEYMKTSIFGERIAHGLLGPVHPSGLGSRAVVRPFATIAFRGCAGVQGADQDRRHDQGPHAGLRQEDLEAGSRDHHVER